MTEFADRQAAAGAQGRAFEEVVAILLMIEGWTIEKRNWRHPEAQIEIDIIAVDLNGVRWWIECKGSWESPTRNGLTRTDTLLKAIGNGALLATLSERCPYMLITSHLPIGGNAGEAWLRAAAALYVDRVRVVGFFDNDYGISPPSRDLP